MNQQKIGAFLAQCRKEKGLTQFNLATRLGVSDRSISKWETGRGMPDLSLFEPLCQELGITITELYYGERRDDPPKESFDELFHRILEEFDQKRRKRNKWDGTIFLLLGLFLGVNAILSSTDLLCLFYGILGCFLFCFGIVSYYYKKRKLTFSRKQSYCFLFSILGLM